MREGGYCKGRGLEGRDCQCPSRAAKCQPGRGLRELASRRCRTAPRLEFLSLTRLPPPAPSPSFPQDVWVLVPEPDNPAATTALAALVAAMLRQDQLAILRFAPRDAIVALCAATPVAGGSGPGGAPPHLLLNTLPFMEDCRLHQFGSFARPDRWAQVAGGWLWRRLGRRLGGPPRWQAGWR